MIAFDGATPILRVEDLGRSVAFYTGVLGFGIEFHSPGVIACVVRDKVHLFLVEGDQGHAGGWVWIGVSDVAPLHEEWRAKGAKIRVPPTNYAWAFEMHVEDPDGNVLRVGSDPKEDVPRGEWVDMHGTRWAPQPGGGWKRVE